MTLFQGGAAGTSFLVATVVVVRVLVAWVLVAWVLVAWVLVGWALVEGCFVRHRIHLNSPEFCDCTHRACRGV